MRIAAVIVFLGVLIAACGAPNPPSLDPSTELACRLMPQVRQIQKDIHEAVEAAGRGDATATKQASERAGSDGKALAAAVTASGLPRDAPDRRLVQVLSVGLWGQQVWSFFTGGVPDRPAIAKFVATTNTLNSLVEAIGADLVAAGLSGC